MGGVLTLYGRHSVAAPVVARSSGELNGLATIHGAATECRPYKLARRLGKSVAPMSSNERKVTTMAVVQAAIL